MTQAQQSEAQRLAAICESKGMFPVADELNRMQARILELEQGKCLHHIAEPAQTARPAFEAISQFMKCEWSLDWDKAGFYSDVKVDAAFTWFEKGYMRAQHAAAPQAVQPVVPETREALAKRLIADVQVADTIATAACQRVAELPDRDSPADWPEAMLVTGDELHMIVREAVIEDQATPAHPAEGVPAQAFKTKVFQALGIGSARDEHVVFVNIENLCRRADCLSAIEREFFMVETPPDESEGDLEPGEECLLNWAHSPEQYVKQFAEALAATQPAAQGMDAQDAARYRWLRNESWACYNIAKKKPEVALVAVVRDGACNIKMVLAEDAMDTAVDAALAAQAKQGGA